MKLSVIIPVYNGANFIEKSYYSIVNQELRDYEIIYVDNNSTDRTKENILDIQRKDVNVHYCFQSKQGAAPARNMGIKKALGDYIYLFDVDDELYPNAIKSLMKVLDENEEVDAVFGKMVKSNNGISKTKLPQDETNQLILNPAPYWGLEWFASLKQVVGPPAFLYRNSVFDKIGLYNESLKNNEDTAFDIKLGMQCNIVKLDKYVYLYFKHDNSTIEISKRNMSRAFMMWPRLCLEHLPYYLQQKTPLRYKTILFSQLYQNMARQLVCTHGRAKRIDLKKQLENDIRSVKLPWLINLYLNVLVTFPIEVVRKFYAYYIVPFVIKRQFKSIK
ncbi:glycosyltransferase family 2 protein [Formosa sp. A9]|uniref:glycosyltransferase family 2 protein n=1 Tax=Formosa sp. A9 TaxID=3442641 RepID=UPI003EB8E4F2